MHLLPWAIGIGALLLLGLSPGVPARASEQRPSQRRSAWIKALGALRIVLGAALAMLAFRAVLDAAASAPVAVRWTASMAAGGALLLIVLNALVGLWLLSPFIGAGPGAEISAAGARGTLRGYGWFCLQLTTRAGWTAHLLYLSIAFRPLVLRRPDGPQLFELELRRDQWSDEELRHAQQLAVLSPYRDPSWPVSISRGMRVATLRFGLARRASRERAQRHLERALARLRERPPAGARLSRSP
jgi:hypothetical protein